jgi:hypothetical protein
MRRDQVMNSLEKAIYLATSNDIAAAAVHTDGVRLSPAVHVAHKVGLWLSPSS